MPYYTTLDDYTIIKHNAWPNFPKHFERSPITFQDMLDITTDLDKMGFMSKKTDNSWYDK